MHMVEYVPTAALGHSQREKEQRADQSRTRARARHLSVKEKTRRRNATRVLQGESVVSDGHWGVVFFSLAC